VAGYFIRTVEADAAADGSVETAELLGRLRSYEATRPLLEDRVAVPPESLVLVMHFRKGDEVPAGVWTNGTRCRWLQGGNGC
jgi:hypothetical protein